ncbi:MAG: hypothetical protein HY518_02805 [Candidatus Aenigmarchaeota archaeon]|nr:hypothetical protein [Candidatus Aenigmarchaeota archaeon]
MRCRTALTLALGVIAVDGAVNRAYESAIGFLGRYPGLRGNPVGRVVEGALIDGYLSRNIPREPTYGPPLRPAQAAMMDD